MHRRFQHAFSFEPGEVLPRDRQALCQRTPSFQPMHASIMDYEPALRSTAYQPATASRADLSILLQRKSL